jgi:hypothetical protein
MSERLFVGKRGRKPPLNQNRPQSLSRNEKVRLKKKKLFQREGVPLAKSFMPA